MIKPLSNLNYAEYNGEYLLVTAQKQESGNWDISETAAENITELNQSENKINKKELLQTRRNLAIQRFVI